MGALSDFRADRSRYPPAAWLTHRSLWAVAAHRLAKAIDSLPPGLRSAGKPVSGVTTLLARIATNIEIPTSAQIGPGLRFAHAGPVVINGSAIIGRNCWVGMGVVIGSARGEEAPTIGDDVILGTYAVVLGDITVGAGAHVGAMTLVTHDVAPRTLVVGIPARRLKDL